MTEATKRPWDCIGAMITRANELAPVALTGPYIPQCAWPERPRDEAEANAQLIVEAVNAYNPALPAVVEELREALHKYGSHLHGCDIHRTPTRKGGINKCDCGYLAALTRVEEMKGEGE